MNGYQKPAMCDLTNPSCAADNTGAWQADARDDEAEARRELESGNDWERRALDWETVTPIEELPAITLRSRLKRELRLWRERSRPAV